MNKISIAAASMVTAAELPSARLGQRFGRLDLQSQLAMLAVASLQIDFAVLPPDRIGICLAASAGSLTTDLSFWNGRSGAGGPSPTLFAYTLPSAAIGEIAIHFGLTGPNLCFVGDDKFLIPEAVDLIRSDKVVGCVCVYCEVVSAAVAEIISSPTTATAWAIFLQRTSLRGTPGTISAHQETLAPAATVLGVPIPGRLRELREIDRDMKPLCALLCAAKSVS